MILNSISLNILAQSDRIFITKFCGADFTGIYSLAYSYAILINIVLNAANEAWLPWFHDSLNDNLKDEIRKNVKPLIVFGCWFGVGCIAIAPEAGDVMHLSQNVVETFIDRIEVFNDERVKIRFTFEDVLKSYEAE